MDGTMFNNNAGVYGGNYYGQPQFNNPSAYYGYQAYMPQTIRVPQNLNALSDEEIATLENTRPAASTINLNIDQIDALRAICTHKKNGRDMVQMVQDGTGEVYCPICGERWNPNVMDKDEVTTLVNELLGQMQNAKWTGDLPVNLARELFTLMPLLKKYPDVHKYAMDNFNKYYGQHQFNNAQDAAIYAQYNSLVSPYNNYMTQQIPTNYYNQQPVMSVTNQPGYYQQPGQMPVANQYVNPMQAPMGVNPMAPNQQFVAQANMMMPYSQPVQQPVVNTQQATTQPAFTYGTPQAYTPNAAQQATVTPDGSKITQQADGTTKSEKKIDL